MNTEIQINARYSLRPSKAPGALQDAWDVYDKAKQFTDSEIVFSNGTEAECRAFVDRDCPPVVEHTPGDWRICNDGPHCFHVEDEDGMSVCEIKLGPDEYEANAALIKTSPKLLALLEEYHAMMPSEKAAKVIAEARGWV